MVAAALLGLALLLLAPAPASGFSVGFGRRSAHPAPRLEQWGLRAASSPEALVPPDPTEVPATPGPAAESAAPEKKRWRRNRRRKKSKEKVEVTTVEQLYEEVDVNGRTLGELSVIGDCEHPLDHPTAEIIRRRVAEKSKPGQRAPGDDAVVALSFEGGGMRGCVGAGIAVGLWYSGVLDACDVVYGSSAGSLIGAYVVAQQGSYNFGPEIYYDMLPLGGNSFINTAYFLRCVGLGAVSPRPNVLRELFASRMGSPVLNLSYLLDRVVKQLKPLDFDLFWEANKKQPLKIVASGLLSNQSVVLDSAAGNFGSLDELTRCMWASMLLPGITGPAVRLNTKMAGTSVSQVPWLSWGEKWGSQHMSYAGEPLGDAMIFEPIPWRSAVKEGATHVIAARTRPDGVSVVSKSSPIEKMLYRRWFSKKHKLPHMADHMVNQRHKVIYAEDVLRLNKESRKRSSLGNYDESEPHLLPIALPLGSEEIGRLEMGRKEIFEGVRRGFAAAYDQCHPDPQERGRGGIVAKEVFPDSILDRLAEDSLPEGTYYDDLPGAASKEKEPKRGIFSRLFRRNKKEVVEEEA